MIIKEVTVDRVANAVTFKYIKKEGEQKFKTGVIKATEKEPIEEIVKKLDRMACTLVFKNENKHKKKSSYGKKGKFALSFLCLQNQKYYQNIEELSDDFGWDKRLSRQTISRTGRYRGYTFEVFCEGVLKIPKNEPKFRRYKTDEYIFDIEGTVKSEKYWANFFGYKTVHYLRKKLLTGNFEGLDVKLVKKVKVTKKELRTKWI